MKFEFSSDLACYLFHEGNLFRSYELFGAHVMTVDGQTITKFCVWAPHAQRVSVAGSFNNWNGSKSEMVKVNDQGIWELVISENLNGHLYKYEIITQKGISILKSDPFAFFSELRPKTASIIYSLDGYKWNDMEWKVRKQKSSIYKQPVAIYEVHLGSWRKKPDGSFYSYKELAKNLIPYVKEHGFTHIELLPLVEHPFDRSWGYQGTGYFSVTSRYGNPHDFMLFVDQCHQHNIGVLLDWVLGHFCKDSHGLYLFDGEPVYEYLNENDRENHIWGTANFDLGKNEIHSFLISNAMFWVEKYHIDGFRVDAVANILYWPNQSELHSNPYAVSLLKKLNQTLFGYDPTLLMIAEDSTDWPLVTAPTVAGGLGFNYKWNMGWMNDILEYMEADPLNRCHLHHKVTFSLLYAFSENFILPLSHDEVVHGKKSLLNKMPGDYWRKFAQLRFLLGYWLAHPGKKLLFMGGEFGQYDEWKDLQQLDWCIEGYEMHSKFHHFFHVLLAFYKKTQALYEVDHSHNGFEWIDVHNSTQMMFSFIRRGTDEKDLFVFVFNASEQVYHQYKIGVPFSADYIEVLNTDEEEFGGSGQVNNGKVQAKKETYHGKPYSISITVPPFGMSVFKPLSSE